MFEVLLTGKFPKAGPGRVPFQERWRAQAAGRPLLVRGACISKCGDWAWPKQVLGLQGWRGEGVGKRICWICRAGFNDVLHCHDFLATAPWRQALVSMGDFWRSSEEDNAYKSTIWKIPGFCLSFIRLDWMHLADLGILQACLGNVFLELWTDLGGTRKCPQAVCGKL